MKSISKRSKKGAMELSVGTIVVFVLSMSVLVLGFFLVQRIFSVATSAVDLTDQQLRNEISKLFVDETRTTIYPGTREVEIRQDESGGVGVGIRNLENNEDVFSYEVRASPGNNCPVNFAEDDAMSLITVGDTDSGIRISPGDFIVRTVSFEPPVGTALCTIRYTVDITSSGNQVFSDYFDIRILPRQG